MVTLAQRIQELRDERGMTRPALAVALGFPAKTIEKFETGRQTPTKEQLDKMTSFFQVSIFYLKGESNDRTSQDNWMDAKWADDPTPEIPIPRKAPKPAPAQSSSESGTVFSALLKNKDFQEMVRATVLDVLRSPEGNAILSQVVRKELDRRR